jgi:chemotaxis protein CheX
MPNSNADALYCRMLDACCQSIVNTFEQMVFLPATVGEAFEKRDGLPMGCISGTIGLSGSHDELPNEVRSKLSLIFPEGLAEQVFRGMMMMGPDDPVEINEVRDMVGELTNMTAGGAKTLLSEVGFKLALSLPTVAVGHDHYLGAPSGVAFSKVIPVTIEHGLFHFEISIS